MRSWCVCDVWQVEVCGWVERKCVQQVEVCRIERACEVGGSACVWAERGL